MHRTYPVNRRARRSASGRWRLRHRCVRGCESGRHDSAGEFARDKRCGPERCRLQPRPHARNRILPVRHDDRLRQQHSSPADQLHHGAASGGLPVDGLSPGTAYHFRIVARNSTGTVTGADQTFTTPSPGTVPRPPQLAVRSVSIAGRHRDRADQLRRSSRSAMLRQFARQGPRAPARTVDRLGQRERAIHTRLPEHDEGRRCRERELYVSGRSDREAADHGERDRQETACPVLRAPHRAHLRRSAPSESHDYVRLSAPEAAGHRLLDLDAATMRAVRDNGPTADRRGCARWRAGQSVMPAGPTARLPSRYSSHAAAGSTWPAGSRTAVWARGPSSRS